MYAVVRAPCACEHLYACVCTQANVLVCARKHVCACVCMHACVLVHARKHFCLSVHAIM